MSLEALNEQVKKAGEGLDRWEAEGEIILDKRKKALDELKNLIIRNKKI